MKRLHPQLRNKFRAAFLSLWVSFGVVSYIPPVDASLSFGPTHIFLQAGRTQTTGTFSVGNTSDQPLRVRVSATAFTYDEKGKFHKTDGSEGFDLTPYLRYSPRELTIPPNSSRRIRFAAIMPPSLPEGEYRAAVFAETLASNDLDESGTQSNQLRHKINYLFSMGSAVYIRRGNVSPALTVRQAEFSSTDQNLRLHIHNEGTATAKAAINWELKRNGETISRGTGHNSFLPNHTVQSLLKPEDSNSLASLPAGTYQLTGEFQWQEDTPTTESFNIDFQIKQ